MITASHHRARPSLQPLEDRVTPSPAGDLDPIFGSGGRVFLPLDTYNSQGGSRYLPINYKPQLVEGGECVLQPDGKVLLAGTYSYEPNFGGDPRNFLPRFYEPYLIRLNADGAADTTFRTDLFGDPITGGFWFEPPDPGYPNPIAPPAQYAEAVALAPDGKIVVAGRALNYHAVYGIPPAGSHPEFDFAVARLNPDGSPDPTFGGDGTVTVRFDPAGDEAAYAVAVQPDGRVVVAGTVGESAGSDFGILRLNPDGSLDPTFGGTGKVAVSFDLGGGDNDTVAAVRLTDDGKVLVAGSAETAAGTDFAAARLNPDGSSDPTFGGAGKVTVAFDLGGGGNDVALDVGVLPDARGLVLVGSAESPGAGGGPSTTSFAAARLNVDGSLDPTFGAGGTVTIRFTPGNAERANAVAVQPDGKVILAGEGGGGFLVARLNADDCLDPAFGSAGEAAVYFPDEYPGYITAAAHGLVLRPDGRLVVTGAGSAFDDYRAALGGRGGFAAAQLLGDPPSISDVPDQAVPFGSSVGPLAFTVNDLFTPAGELAITATSGNQDLVPAVGIVLGGGGGVRTITITPAAGRYGMSTITVAVRDAAGQTATDTFVVTVDPPPPPPAPVVPVLVGGQTDGSAVRLVPAGGQLVPDEPVVFFPDFVGSVRTAAADVTGDGVADLVGGAGPGGGPRVAVIDGATGARVADFFAFEPGFGGGVFVAAGDLDGDGRAELVVTPDRGGGPVVTVFDGTGAGRGRFLGIDDPGFRGGARAALGDVNADGTPDLVVSAGSGGGPRVAVFDGRSLPAAPARLVPDFFAFEPALRNGAFVAAGDLDSDGSAELALGSGAGGAPRVRVVSGRVLPTVEGLIGLDPFLLKPPGLVGPSNERLLDLAHPIPPGLVLADLFAGDPALRAGVRVAVKDADGDGRADLATGSGEGEPSRVRVYREDTLLAGGTTPDQVLDPFGAVLTDGVFVG